MSFKKYQNKKMSNNKRLELCNEFEQRMKTRRSVREFSKKDVSQEIIEKIVRISASAPSGANKEPWYFSIVKDMKIKKEINKEKSYAKFSSNLDKINEFEYKIT